MSEEQRSSTKDYLGDSVYAEVTDEVVRLTTENGMGASNTIYLEPQVITALIRYAQRYELIKKSP